MIRLLRPLLWGSALALLACARNSGGTADPPLPRTDLTPEDRAAWYQLLAWPEECERSFVPTNEADGGLTFYPLAEGRSLVEVVCLVAAYQRSHLYLMYDERTTPPQARLLRFPTYVLQPGQSWAPHQSAELTGIPEFDAAGDELTVLTRFRGVGDCGSVARYGFEGGQPVLLDFRGKVECDGRAEGWERIGP
ncbi:hypothetical protein BH23GEM7_BH23GEM7_12670 [soil metagenome]